MCTVHMWVCVGVPTCMWRLEEDLGCPARSLSIPLDRLTEWRCTGSLKAPLSLPSPTSHPVLGLQTHRAMPR